MKMINVSIEGGSLIVDMKEIRQIMIDSDKGMLKELQGLKSEVLELKQSKKKTK